MTLDQLFQEEVKDLMDYTEHLHIRDNNEKRKLTNYSEHITISRIYHSLITGENFVDEFGRPYVL